MIYFACPDFVAKSGGIKRLHHVVSILNDANINACILHNTVNYKIDWHGIDVPRRYVKKVEFTEKDIIVIPEGCVPFMKMFKDNKAKKIAFVMSIEYIMSSLPIGVTWKDYNINQAICTTMHLENFVQSLMGIEAVNIGFSIDFDKYYYKPELKENIIVYPGRPESNVREADTIFKILNMNIDNKKWLMVPLVDYNVEDYAVMMRKAKFYLTFVPRWGCNSSVVEAMACGTIVGGYKGIGYEEIVDTNNNLSEYGDCFNVAFNIYCLGSTLDCFEKKKNEIINMGINKTHHYILDYEKDCIISYFKQELER